MTLPDIANASAPSAVSFKMRFPEFVTITDDQVNFALEEALLFMGSWCGRGKIPAQLYLAAHIIAVQQFAGNAGGRDIVSETLGKISTTYREPANKGAFGDLSSTVYGVRYKQLADLNIKQFTVLNARKDPHFRDRW